MNQKFQIELLEDRMIVEPKKRETETESGLILPGEQGREHQEGRVVEVGPGRITDSGKKIPMRVKKGDTVIYGLYAGVETEVRGQTLLVLTQDAIIGIIRE